jgi:hypothetical protein
MQTNPGLVPCVKCEARRVWCDDPDEQIEVAVSSNGKSLEAGWINGAGKR